jgi:hypothetical protein
MKKELPSHFFFFTTMYKTEVEAIFSAPVQTGPGAHPASCAMGKESPSCG